MMRRRMGRPGLVGTMARTAVIAGTASAVAGGVQGRRQARVQGAQDQMATQASAASSQAELAEMEARIDAMEAPSAPLPPPPTAAPAAGGGDDLLTQLQKLGDMKASGLLDDAEFAAAKAKLLA